MDDVDRSIRSYQNLDGSERTRGTRHSFRGTDLSTNAGLNPQTTIDVAFPLLGLPDRFPAELPTVACGIGVAVVPASAVHHATTATAHIRFLPFRRSAGIDLASLQHSATDDPGTTALLNTAGDATEMGPRVQLATRCSIVVDCASQGVNPAVGSHRERALAPGGTSMTRRNTVHRNNRPPWKWRARLVFGAVGTLTGAVLLPLAYASGDPRWVIAAFAVTWPAVIALIRALHALMWWRRNPNYLLAVPTWSGSLSAAIGICLSPLGGYSYGWLVLMAAVLTPATLCTDWWAVHHHRPTIDAGDLDYWYR